MTLWGRIPPIEKLDNTLGTLKKCKRVRSLFRRLLWALRRSGVAHCTPARPRRHLSLSTNNIAKIAGLTDLPKCGAARGGATTLCG